MLMAMAVLAFFRDPPRTVPADANSIISPADGLVVVVEQCEEPSFIRGPATCVAIFLSVFDVHINRIPVSGVIKYRAYIPGGHRSALRRDAGKLNERSHVGIESGGKRFLVCQIAGLLARRVVCRVKEGDHVRKGERFGLIKFGSRVEVYLPPEARVIVTPGTRVRGGETVIAILDEN